jgi:hypothetical protein
MAIASSAPRTIYLGGEIDSARLTTNLKTAEAIKPGYLVEGVDAGSGVNEWQKNSSATEYPEMAVALNRPYLNLDFDTVVPLGDLVDVMHMRAGEPYLMWIPSGQDITNGDLLQSNGDGLLKAATATTATANVARFRAIGNPGSVTVETSLRVRVIG